MEVTTIVFICSLLIGGCFSVDDRVTELKIGGVLGDLRGPEAEAFKLAVQKINANQIVLPTVKLVPVLPSSLLTDTYENIKQVNDVLDQGVVAVVGPLNSLSVRISQAIAAHLHVPQIAPTSDSTIFTENASFYEYLLRMSPSTEHRMKVATDFIKYNNWTKFSVLTSMSDEGMDGLHILQQTARKHHWTLQTIEHFHTSSDVSQTNATNQLLSIKEKQSRIVILKCYLKYVTMVMKKAEELDMIDDWVWIITNMDSYNDVLFNQDEPTPLYLRGAIGIQQSMGHGVLYDSFKLEWSQTGQRHAITPAVARTYDSIVILATAMHRLFEDGHEMLHRQPVENGTDPVSWDQGDMFLKYIKQVQTEGVMNQLSFVNDGTPEKVYFDVVNLQKNGVKTVGSWNVKGGLNIHSPIIWSSGVSETPRDSPNYLRNKHLKIVTYLLDPFVMMDEDGQFYGICVDLLEEIRQNLGFKYEIYVSPSGDIGQPQTGTNLWNGIVGELMSKKADLAIGAITISPERQEVIDYTQPFMNFGLQIIMSTPPPPDKLSSYFRFLSPFKFSLWLAILATVIIMGVVNWLFSVLSPYGYYGRVVQALDQRKVNPQHVKTMNDLNVWNSIWASVAYYLSQGPDGLHPESASGRCAIAAWWFGITILGATYTANMAAYFTVSRLNTPIASIEDLSSQTDIHYGTTSTGQPKTFFEMSTIPKFTMMWQFMNHYNTLVNNTEEAYQRVKEDNYAFIYDEPVLEYSIHHRFCQDFVLVGRAFGHFGYGFGLPEDSPFTQSLNVQILKLLNSGKIEQIKQKWFYDKTKCHTDDHDDSGEETSLDNDRLDIENMLGVFLLMFGGIVFGFVALIAEWIHAVRNDCKNDKSLNPCSALARRVNRMCKTLCGRSRGQSGEVVYSIRQPMLSPDGSSTPKRPSISRLYKAAQNKQKRSVKVRWQNDGKYEQSVSMNSIEL